MMYSVSGVAIGKHAGTRSDLLAKKHAERDTYSHTNPDYLASMQRGSCARVQHYCLLIDLLGKLSLQSPMH
jgi:hypothetical protein